jgi:hypothetical protein
VGLTTVGAENGAKRPLVPACLVYSRCFFARRFASVIDVTESAYARMRVPVWHRYLPIPLQLTFAPRVAAGR